MASAFGSILTGAGIGGGVGTGVGALLSAGKSKSAAGKTTAIAGVAGTALGALIGVPTIGGAVGKALGGLLGGGDKKVPRPARPAVAGSLYGAQRAETRKKLREIWSPIDEKTAEAFGVVYAKGWEADQSLLTWLSDDDLNAIAAGTWGGAFAVGKPGAAVAAPAAVAAVAAPAAAAAEFGGQISAPAPSRFPTWGYLAIGGGVLLVIAVIFLRR